MQHKLTTIILMTIWLLSPVLAHAAKTTYIFTDRKFNYVKRMELKEKELKDLKLNHPYTFTELQLREMLAAIRFNRKVMFQKETEEVAVFDQNALDFLVPYLVKGFTDVQANEVIVFSVLNRKLQFLVRDDRLSIVRAWIEENRLHLDFNKLMARVSPNYDKMSDVSAAINRAEGMHVALDVGPGQQFGKNTDELLVDIPNAETLATAVAQSTAMDNKEKATATATPPLPEKVDGSIEGRLQRLDNLRKKGLINQDEYQAKKKEILEKL